MFAAHRHNVECGLAKGNEFLKTVQLNRLRYVHKCL